MNYSPALLLASFFALTSLVAAYGILDNPLLVRRETDFLQRIRGLRHNILRNGCPINLCFAVDGSDSIRPSQFEVQKNFVDLSISIVATDDPANFSAVQYGTTNRIISPLTFRKQHVVRKLFRSRQIDGISNTDSGLGYCGFQLRGQLDYPKKLIIISDGFESIRSVPSRVAKHIHKDDVSISAVSVGPSNIDHLIAITGDKRRVLMLEGFFEIGEIIVDVVRDVCAI